MKSSAPPALAALMWLPMGVHEREFTHSRDWHLPHLGEHELELRTFFDTSHGDYRGQLEYEYGVTRHFAFEPGVEFQEDEDGDFEIEGASLELRFNFGEYRQGAWLPALNLEYEHAFEEEEADALEVQTVLSRYGERDDISFNLNFVKELEHELDDESAFTAGWVHDFGTGSEGGAGRWKAGLEVVEDFEEHHLRAGPLVTWRATPYLNLLASYLPAIDDRGDGNFDELAIIFEFEL